MDVDIEDAVPAGPPPGFRVPIRAVNIQPRKANHKHNPNHMMHIPSSSVPGTQAIYVKTFGCSHNQSDSEYMTGQLSAYGYGISDNPDEADLWLINTCTVKSPSQSAMETIIRKGKSLKKPLVVAGCVPQGSRDMKELAGISLIGVQQIDNIVHVVEETLKGHEVRLLRRNTLPALDLPKVRKNKFIEILPINVGCLGACTYCKTKHARGHLGSYKLEVLVERAKTVIAEGVKEIWLSSEDTGAYGRDIGLTLPTLLKALVAVLPSDRSTMLRIGMTNPPYILEDLEEIAAILHHPCVYSFLHVPVQSGSDTVLNAMKREYTVSEFKRVVDTLMLRVPGIQIATDIICGFPGETNEDFEKTIKLIEGYKFAQVHISQFYPRPGTPAARMKKVPTSEVKKRSRMLTSIFESFTPYAGMEGQTQRIWIADAATDGIHLVGHTKSYVQVLIRAPVTLLGRSVDVKITSVGRWSVFGDIISMPYCQENSHETTADTNAHEVQFNEQTACSVSCSCVSTGNSGKQCMCLKQEEYSCCDLPKSCCCHAESVDRKADFDTKKNIDVSKKDEKHLYCSSEVFGTVLKKSVSSFLSMRNRIHKDTQTEANELHQIVSPKSHHRVEGFSVVDWVLLGGIALSFVIFVLLILQF